MLTILCKKEQIMSKPYQRAFKDLSRLTQEIGSTVKSLDVCKQQAGISAQKANETITSEHVNADSTKKLQSNSEVLSEEPQHDTPISGDILPDNTTEARLLFREKIITGINSTLGSLSPRTAGLILDSRRPDILSQIGNVRDKFTQENNRRGISTKDYRSPTSEANKQLSEEIYREIAHRKGKTYEQMCKEADEHAQDLFKDAELWTRTQPEFLEKILETGVFKSRPELDQASGKQHKSFLLSADTRMKTEQQIFGYPEDHPVDGYPFYGHPSDDNYGKIGEDLVSPYGNIAVRFKKSLVVDATTLAADDTAKHSEGSIKPVPWKYLHRGIFPLMKYVDGQLVKKYQNPLEIRSMHEIYPYPEIQIHPSWLEGHRLTLEHIDLVVIRNPLYNRQLKDDQGNTKDRTLSLIAALENVEWLKKKVGSLKFLDQSYSDQD
jgi:hypothetical protein